MSAFQLAQINIGRLVAPYNSPPLAEFVANLGRINALADASPGFVWRLTGAGNDATDIQAFDDPMVAMNMSVWESLEALAAFAYRSAHRDFMRRRREWFEAPAEAYMAPFTAVGCPPPWCACSRSLQLVPGSGTTLRL